MNKAETIAVITYDHPHQKTQDLLCRLLLRGYSNIELVVTEWKDRPIIKPLYPHRPDNPLGISVENLCENLKINFKKCNVVDLGRFFMDNTYKKILIGGVGILPDDITGFNIINSHPGYLPHIRGLDALKWAIFKGEPIGVTTYYIGRGIDVGVSIKRKILPLYPMDTFCSIARRQYEMEIDMLVDSITDIPENILLDKDTGNSLGTRMTPIDEVRMIHRLENMLRNL